MHQGQIVYPPLTKTNKILLILLGVGVLILPLLENILSLNLSAYLGLSGLRFFSGHLYQMITYPFIENSLINILFDALAIWFVGGELEQICGTKKYRIFILVSILSSAIFFLLINFVFFQGHRAFAYPLNSFIGVVQSLILGYGLFYPDREFSLLLIFPIKAKYFSLVIVAMTLYMGIYTPFGLKAWAQLAGMLGAISYLAWTFPNVFFLLKNMLQDLRLKIKKKMRNGKVESRKSHLSIVKKDEEDDGPPKYYH